MTTLEIALTKTCTGCRLEKPIEEFYLLRRSGDARQPACRDCTKVRVAQVRDQRRQNGKARAYSLGVEAPRVWARQLLERYGLTVAEYDAILAAQNGVCAICGEPPGEVISKTGTVRRLAVDHDHVSGANRGLLCARCNQGVGYFRDRADLLTAAISYLERRG